MKKIDISNKYFKISFSIFSVIAASILFEKFLGNIDFIFEKIIYGVKFSFEILEPFIFGFFIAYFLNPIVIWIEDKIFTRMRYKRLLSVITTYIIFLGSLIWIFIYLVPEVAFSVKKFILIFPDTVKNFNKNGYGFFYQVLDTYNATFNKDYDLPNIMEFIATPFIKSVLSLPQMADNILSRTFEFASSLLNFILGIVIAFYLLCDKERFYLTLKKLIYIICGAENTEKIFCSLSNYNFVFQKFIIGKTIDSIIIALLFFIIGRFIKIPYLILLSLIIGISNMIPYFGPFIGAIPVVFIVLLNNSVLAFWVAVIIFILQQFDGIILGPKILGNSTGLKPLEVIFAIIIGGAMFGVVGMFFGVPVFAVILKILRDLLNKKYEEAKGNGQSAIGEQIHF